MRKAAGAFILGAAALTAPAAADFGSNMIQGLPTVLGQMAAQQAAAEFEARCLAGTPASEWVQKGALRDVRRLMASYFQLAAARSAKLHDLIRGKDEGGRWIGPENEADLEKLVDPYLTDATHTVPEEKSILVSGDGQTVRGIWSLTVENPDEPAVPVHIEYGVDFLKSYWRGFRIWHVRVFEEPATAPVPVQYCHFDAAAGY